MEALCCKALNESKQNDRSTRYVETDREALTIVSIVHLSWSLGPLPCPLTSLPAALLTFGEVGATSKPHHSIFLPLTKRAHSFAPPPVLFSCSTTKIPSSLRLFLSFFFFSPPFQYTHSFPRLQCCSFRCSCNVYSPSWCCTFFYNWLNKFPRKTLFREVPGAPEPRQSKRQRERERGKSKTVRNDWGKINSGRMLRCSRRGGKKAKSQRLTFFSILLQTRGIHLTLRVTLFTYFIYYFFTIIIPGDVWTNYKRNKN